MSPFTYERFLRATMEGDLNQLNWLTRPEIESAKVSSNDFMLAACVKNHLPVAQWISANMSVSNEGYAESFVNACRVGNLEVAKWIEETRLHNIKLKVDYVSDAHRLSKDQPHVIEWMNKKFGTDV
jgi:hypothetical protein